MDIVLPIIIQKYLQQYDSHLFAILFSYSYWQMFPFQLRVFQERARRICLSTPNKSVPLMLMINGIELSLYIGGMQRFCSKWQLWFTCTLRFWNKKQQKICIQTLGILIHYQKIFILIWHHRLHIWNSIYQHGVHFVPLAIL